MARRSRTSRRSITIRRTSWPHSPERSKMAQSVCGPDTDAAQCGGAGSGCSQAGGVGALHEVDHHVGARDRCLVRRGAAKVCAPSPALRAASAAQGCGNAASAWMRWSGSRRERRISKEARQRGAACALSRASPWGEAARSAGEGMPGAVVAPGHGNVRDGSKARQVSTSRTERAQAFSEAMPGDNSGEGDLQMKSRMNAYRAAPE